MAALPFDPMSMLLPNLADWIRQDYMEQLSGVKDKMEDMERELRLMDAFFNTLEHPGESENQLADDMMEVSHNATDVIDTLLLRRAKRRRQGVFKRCAFFFSYMRHRYKLSKNLSEAMSRIHDLSERRRSYDISSTTGQGQAPPSAVFEGAEEQSEITSLEEKTGPALVERLTTLLSHEFFLSHEFVVYRGMMEHIKRIKIDFNDVLRFLKDMESVEPDERLKAWIEDLGHIIDLAESDIKSFMKREQQIRSKSNILVRTVSKFSHWRSQRTKIQCIEGKIQQTLHRNRAYRIGGTNGRRAPRSTLPSRTMQQNIRNRTYRLYGISISIMIPQLLPLALVAFSVDKMIKITLAPPVASQEDEVETINQNLTQMNALFKDVEKIANPDEILNIWVEEMRIVASDANEVTDTFKTAQQRRRGTVKRFFLIFSGMIEKDKQGKKLTQVMRRIHYQLERLTTYDISFGTRKGQALPSPENQRAAEPLVSTLLSDLIGKFTALLSEEHFIINHRMKDDVKRISHECNLLLCVLKDMELMEPDQRLKAWMKDMRDIIHNAHGFMDSFTNRTQQIRSRSNMFTRAISIFSHWGSQNKLNKDFRSMESKIQEAVYRKWAYGIKDIKGRKTQSSIVPSLEQNLQQTNNDRAQRSSFVRRIIEVLSSQHIAAADEVESISRDLTLMHALLEDVEPIEDRDGILKAWVGEIREVARDAENVIDTYANRTKKKWRVVCNSVNTENVVVKDIDRIRKTIDNICERRMYYGVKDNRQMQQLSSPDEVQPGVIVFDDDVQTLTTMLDAEDQRRCVISIVGTKGIGKTTLAGLIYRSHHTAVHLFPSRAWVSIDKNLSTTELLEQIVEQVIGCQKQKGKSIRGETPVEQLHALLTDSRYLIVLDDVCTKDTWDSLKEAFPDTPNGSRIVLTTLYIDTAWHADSKSHQLRLLSKNESWNSYTRSLKLKIPPEVTGNGDLRLVILKSEVSSSALEMPGMIETDLNFHLRRCLYYFALFPANFEIPARRLIALWVAEGLAQPMKGDNETPEYVAQGYLSELVKLNMVQVMKEKANGKVKTCCLPEALRELCLSRAKNSKFLSNGRLADHLDKKDPSYNHIHSNNGNNSTSLQPYYRNVLSFLSFDLQEGSKPGEHIENFLSRCISSKCLLFLRVLDLECVFRPKLPKEVGKLILMRYLGLRWTQLETLPSFISNLLNLQTLDLKHTYISTLPKSIWKMQQLRHLYLSEGYRTRFVPRPSGGSLADLQTLWGVFIDEKILVRDGLDSLLNLRKLGLAFRFMSTQTDETSPQLDAATQTDGTSPQLDAATQTDGTSSQLDAATDGTSPQLDAATQTDGTSSQLDAVANWVLKLKHLQSLRLRSHNELNQPWDLDLHPLSSLIHLSSIYLLGRLKNPSVVTEFPTSLIELTLSATRLADDPMSTFDKLPNLKILRLFSESYIGSNMVCISGGFLKLEVLKIWMLDQLVEWTVQNGALPTLTNLEIRSCKKLKMLPNGLQHVKTLHELKLTNMPDKFKARTEAYRGEDWEKIVHIRCVLKEDYQN